MKNVQSYNFGFRNSDLDSVASSLADLLGIEWERREGDAHGGDYYRFLVKDRQSYVLQRNHAEFMSWVAPNYSQYSIILQMRWQDKSSAPNSADLLQQFSTVFPDVICFSDEEGRRITLLKALRLEPLAIVVLLISFFANLRKPR